ncbi:50S ribosomal protein L32 [bacterium]|nr:50S ribosomal protein L32 [bacterium]
MAVPRSRISNSRRNKRRAHDFKTPKTLNTCSNCKSFVVAHHICESCGFYKGKSYKKTEQA